MGISLDAGSAKRKGATPAMNVTPLVDVVLVLLIVFMVVAPLLSKKFSRSSRTTRPPRAQPTSRWCSR